jgi:predicted DNA-binding transcriptional regulator AlpA
MGAVERPRDKALAEVRFLTVAEVAALMRVSKMTVYRLVHSGELPAVRAVVPGA